MRRGGRRVRSISSSRKAGFISGLFVCPGVEDSWQPPIYLCRTSISLCGAGEAAREAIVCWPGTGMSDSDEYNV